MITKQKYKYKYVYEWSDKWQTWVCTSGADMLAKGTELLFMLRELFPDHANELYNIMGLVRFQKLEMNGVRMYRWLDTITIEYERRCTTYD